MKILPSAGPHWETRLGLEHGKRTVNLLSGHWPTRMLIYTYLYYEGSSFSASQIGQGRVCLQLSSQLLKSTGREDGLRVRGVCLLPDAHLCRTRLWSNRP